MKMACAFVLYHGLAEQGKMLSNCITKTVCKIWICFMMEWHDGMTRRLAVGGGV